MSECQKCRLLLENEDGSCSDDRFADEGCERCPKGCHSNISDSLVERLADKVTTYLEELADRGETREACRRSIRDQIKRRRATLVLGAGISIPMGMPNWQGLVSQMSGYAFQYQDYMRGRPATEQKRLLELERKLIFQELKVFGNSNVLESGQYIAQVLGTAAREKSGEELVIEVISAIIEGSKRPVQWQNEHPLKAGSVMAAEQNSLFAAAYALKEGFHRALTYNFDTLTQECLIEIFHVPSEEILTHPGEWNDQPWAGGDKGIEIFHVHGCIPRRANLNCPSSAFPKESKRIVLSEDSYYDTERFEAYNWQNSIQSYHLNRDSCVFVGFSAEDYNFRRILRQMGDVNGGRLKRPRHYLVLTIDDIVRETWKNVCLSRLPDRADPDELLGDTVVLLAQQLKTRADYWKRYGFFPIWVTISGIPRFLLSLLSD